MHDLDLTLQIADGPNHDYVLAVNFRNISSNTCTLNRAADEPSFYLNAAPPSGWFAGCSTVNAGSLYECAPSRASVAGPGVTLAPGATGHQEYRWKTAPSHAGEPCVQTHWMDNTVNQDRVQFLLLSKSLLKPICSEVTAGPYLSGAFTSDAVAAGVPLPTLRAESDKNNYYVRESAPMRVLVHDPGGLLPRDQDSCPVVLVRLRYPPGGGTRFEEAWNHKCTIDAPGGVLTEETVLGISQLRTGDNDVQISALAALRGRQFLVNDPRSLHWNVAEAPSSARQWGPQVHGLAVSLTLDKETYALRRDIPLHIAMQNFAAGVPIFGDSPIWDPPAVKVEVRDACGVPLTPSDEAIWTGHGLCATYAPGQPVSNELTLRQMGLLPKVPGSYTVVVTWKPLTGASCDSPKSPYATVESSPVSFRVVDEKHPEAASNAKCASSPK